MPTIMFQCKGCLSIIRSKEAYDSHMQMGHDLRCPECPATFQNVCGYQAHKFNEHRSRIPFEMAHKASSSSTSSVSYTSAEESPQKPYSTEHQPNGTHNQRPEATSSQRTMPISYAPTPTSQLTNGLPACLPQPVYRFGESAIPLNIGAFNRPAVSSNPPVGELLDLGTEPADDEVEKLEGAIQALHSLVAGKRFGRDQLDAQEEHHVGTSTLENVLENAETPTPAVSEAAQGQDYVTGDSNKCSAEETQAASGAPAAIMGAIVCFECEAIFSTLLGLQHHQIMASHNYCRLCHAFFVDGSLLEEHKENIHNFKCAKCASKFDSWDAVMTHQRITGHCFCKECNCYFTDSDSYKIHTEDHTYTEADLDYDGQYPLMAKYQKGNYACVNCGKILPDQPGLDQHIKQAHTFDCGFTNCNFSGVSADHLKTHQQRMGHNFCYPCSRSFVDHPGFISHRKSEKHMKKVREQSEAKA